MRQQVNVLALPRLELVKGHSSVPKKENAKVDMNICKLIIGIGNCSIQYLNVEKVTSFFLLGIIYERVENTICENQPYLTNDHIASSITSVLDAKEECQRLGSACGGFFDSLGNGNSFIICGAPVLLITSSSVLGSVLYRVEGNKELLCLYFISRIIHSTWKA